MACSPRCSPRQAADVLIAQQLGHVLQLGRDGNLEAPELPAPYGVVAPNPITESKFTSHHHLHLDHAYRTKQT